MGESLFYSRVSDALPEVKPRGWLVAVGKSTIFFKDSCDTHGHTMKRAISINSNYHDFALV